MFVFLYLLHAEYQNLLSTSKVRLFLGSEDRVKVKVRGLFGMIRVSWGMHCVYESPHKDGGTWMCL